MNIFLLLFAVFLVSVSSLAFSQAVGYGGSGGVGFGGDGGYATSQGGAGGDASSVSQGGNGFGGSGYGGAGGDSSSISHGGVGMGGIGTGTGGNASNAGNAQSIHFDQIRQSPAVFMGAPMPTAVCQATAGGFLSFIGGAGFATSFTLAQCEIREEARSLAALGRPDLGLKIMCASAKYTSQLDECKPHKAGEKNDTWDD